MPSGLSLQDADALMGSRWREVLNLVATQPRLSALLRTAIPLWYRSGEFVLGVPQRVQKDHLEATSRRDVEVVLAKVYGINTPIGLRCEVI